MIKHLFRSFAGGEITPELLGRVELSKFQTGLALARNFITLPHGPAARRPGTEFVAPCTFPTKKVRLIPFTYSVDQTVVIEVGDGYCRFYANGAAIVGASKIPSAITKGAPGVVTSTAHGFLTDEMVYVSDVLGMTQLNERFLRVVKINNDTFSLLDEFGAAVNTVGYGTFTGGGTFVRLVQTTAPWAEGDLFDLHYAQNANEVTIVHPDYAARQLYRVSALTWPIASVSFAPTLATPGTVAVTPTVAVAGSPVPQAYVVTSVATDGVTESVATASPVSTTNDLTLAGNYNTVTWAAVAGASRYNVYKRRGGTYGFMGQTTTLAAIDDNILPDTLQTPPETIITLNTGADEYPSAVAYHEQRRWFAGTTNDPQTVYATRTGTDTNLTSSIPARDADAMELRIASLQNNTIRHLVPLSDLLALTAGGEWRLFAEGQPAITPTSVSIKPQGYAGSSNVQPVVTSGSVLYVAAQGSRLREIAYNWEANSYKSIDMSIMAPHRFNGFTISDLTYGKAPDQIVWAVRSDGTLLGMTYVPEHQVYGWHAHDTQGGEFESCCVVAENNEDVLYVVVKRTVDGKTARFIERLRGRLFTDAEDAFFVDSGLTYDGAPATTFSTLWHLEGSEVDILADGAVMPRQTVTNGTITLEDAASVVHIGVPITADLQTLPLAVEGMQAAGQGTMKNVNKVHLRVAGSSLVKAGPSFAKLTEYPARQVSDPMGSAPTLRTGELALSVTPSWNTDAAVCIRQDVPLPLTVLAMTLEVQTGG